MDHFAIYAQATFLTSDQDERLASITEWGKLTCALMNALFSKAEQSTSSVTGRKGSVGEGGAKAPLDHSKVDFIISKHIHVIIIRFYIIDSYLVIEYFLCSIRGIIKCSMFMFIMFDS